MKIRLSSKVCLSRRQLLRVCVRSVGTMVPILGISNVHRAGVLMYCRERIIAINSTFNFAAQKMRRDIL